MPCIACALAGAEDIFSFVFLFWVFFSALVYFKNIQKFLFVCSVIVCDYLLGIHMQFFAIVPIISLKWVNIYKICLQRGTRCLL